MLHPTHQMFSVKKSRYKNESYMRMYPVPIHNCELPLLLSQTEKPTKSRLTLWVQTSEKASLSLHDLSIRNGSTEEETAFCHKDKKYKTSDSENAYTGHSFF